MKRIGIWSSGQISDTNLIGISKFSELRELILSSCSSQGDRRIFKELSQLKLRHLGLFYGINMNPDQDQDFHLLASIPSLTSFHLGGWNLTNNVFLKFSNNYNLTNLSISRSQAISRTGIEYISKNSTISTIRISACIFLKDFDLQPLVSMPQLQRLELDNTKSVTDNFLKFLSENSKISNIEDLIIMGIPLISNRGITHLINLKSLKTLIIKNCQNVSGESVFELDNARVSGSKIMISLDNSEYIQKQQQIQQGQQPQQTTATPAQLMGLLHQVELDICRKLNSIAENQPQQEEQGLQTAYNYQEQLQQLHNLLHNQQRLQSLLHQSKQNSSSHGSFLHVTQVSGLVMTTCDSNKNNWNETNDKS